METSKPGSLFVSRIRACLSKTESRFLDMEQQLLEQKTFEDMTFYSSGLCENNDFYFPTEFTEAPTAREQLCGYLVIREQFDQFASDLLDQLHSIKSENSAVLESWVKEQLVGFEDQLNQLRQH